MLSLMAAVTLVHALCLAHLVLACSGYDNSYGTSYDNSSWCTLGTRGRCLCQNDIVDCSQQGLSSVPYRLPVSTKQLILRNNLISSIDSWQLSFYTSAEFIDLSYNSLRTLPKDIFDVLPNLASIDLSNNPWVCSCETKWLIAWLQSIASRGSVLIFRSQSTTCTNLPFTSLLNISLQELAHCNGPVAQLRRARSANSGPSAINIFPDWSSVCTNWGFSVAQCNRGPSAAAACVLGMSRRVASLVSFSNFTSQTNAATCRNYCFTKGYNYHTFWNSSFNCMCGDEAPSLACSDCNSTTLSTASMNLCSSSYLRIEHAYHVLSDISISYQSPLTINTPVSFTLSGFPSSPVISAISWVFGDGAKLDTVTVSRGTSTQLVKHTFFYPGLFPVTAILCGSGVCHSISVKIKVVAEPLSVSLSCPIVSDVSEAVMVNMSLSSVLEAEVNWSRTDAAGTVYAGGCENGWMAFNDRCVKYVTSSLTYADAEEMCQKQGSALMMLNGLEEVQALLLLGLSAASWVGARYNSSMHMWTSTGMAAAVIQGLSTDRSAGDCLVLSSSGLVAANCSNPYYVLCQKNPDPCPVGKQAGNRSHCFYLASNPSNWENARKACQQNFSGDLATMNKLSDISEVIVSLGISSPNWIGLTSRDLLGHYAWVNGEIPAFGSWSKSDVAWPCVALTVPGQFQPTNCDQMLDFICEYSLNDEVNADLNVAGTLDLEQGASFQELTSKANTSTNLRPSGLTVLLPGIWFTKEGELLEVNFQASPKASKNNVALQIFRPTCTNNEHVIQPGCRQNVFARCGTLQDASSCQAPASCVPSKEKFCPLTNACIPASSPCSCAGLSSPPDYCDATDASSVIYVLVAQLFLEIPAGSGGAFTARFSRGFFVKPNDIMGLESEDRDSGLCSIDASSPWKQVALLNHNSVWMEINKQISVTSFSKQENYVCYISMTYGFPGLAFVPGNLAHVTTSALYTYQAHLVGTSAAVHSCFVETVQRIGNLTWLYPPPSAAANTSGTLAVYVEASVPQDLVAMVSSGSKLVARWQLDRGHTLNKSTVATCPAMALAAHIPECLQPTSQLQQPFVIFTGFTPSMSPVLFTLNVSNPLGWKSLGVMVIGVVPVQGLSLWHSSCSMDVACLPLVEVGLLQMFTAKKVNGTVDSYEYFVNGTVVQQASTSVNMNCTFRSPGVHNVTVRAANGLGFKENFLLVEARIKANIPQTLLSLTSPAYAEVGVQIPLMVSVTATLGAQINITWSYGDGSTDWSMITVINTSIVSTTSHCYIQTGQYNLNVSLLDEFGIATSVSGIVDVLLPITDITVTASPQIVTAGNTTTFNIQIVNGTSQQYGQVTVMIDYADGSPHDVHTVNRMSKSIDHVFSTNGTFNVSLTVKTKISNSTTFLPVIVQLCPSRVKLSYNGPKNVSDQLTFTAEAIRGSDIMYTFFFGDGSENATQADPFALHLFNSSGTYNVTVIAANDVCLVSEMLNVIVMDGNTLIVRKINHIRYAPINQNVVFSLDVITLSVQDVKFAWTSSPASAEINGSKDFNTSFSKVGDHLIAVNVTLLNNPVIVRYAASLITIQEQVSNVSLTGPQLLSFNSTFLGEGTFSAFLSGGTDVAYQWHNGTMLLASAAPTISINFTTAGTFNISVIAHNKVSEIGAWKLLVVQQAIENVSVSCLSCSNRRFLAWGSTASLLCTYQGTSPKINWTLGVITTQNGPTASHFFYAEGPQLVNVYLENLVSSHSFSFELIVEKSILDLKVVPNRPWVGEGFALTMVASVTQGSNIVYRWNCTDQASFNTTTNSSSFNFASWGNHTCQVTAVNNVSSAQANVDVRVLKLISSLGIKNRRANSTLYVPVNRDPGLEAECNTYFMVNISWDVMWNGALISGGHILGSWWDANFTRLPYRFTKEGNYQLHLTAKNELNSMTIVVNVDAQSEIAGLVLNANATAVVVGSAVQLQTSITTGSEPVYLWTVNGTELSNVGSGQLLVHSFASSGTYIVQVTVSNEISSHTVNQTVLVQYPLQNITLAINASFQFDLQQPFLQKDQIVQFIASVLHGSDPVYEWFVISPSVQTVVAGPYLQLAFSEAGEYSLRALVRNNVSQEWKNFSVFVEVPVSMLDVLVLPGEIVSTGQEVNFTALSNNTVTPVRYTWLVDSQDMNATGMSFLHTFSTAGLHIVTLLAQNNITSAHKNLTIEALDPVLALEVKGCNITQKVGVATVLSASALGSGITFSWTIQMPSGDQKFSGQDLAITFPDEGQYIVTLTGENKLGQENFTCGIRVQDVISGIMVNIIHPPVDYIFTNQNMTFTVTGNHLRGAMYTWKFSTGLVTNASSSSTITTWFSAAQTITLEVIVANDVSSATAFRNFTVQDLKCNLPVVTPVGNDTRVVLRSMSVQFDVYIDNKGCSHYLVVHTWQVYEADDCTTRPPSSATLSLGTVDTTKPTFILPTSLLPFSRNRYCIHYTMGYQKTPVAEEVFYNLTVLPSPLVAIIAGGGWRMVDGTREICLDGSLSYSPDDPSSGSGGIIFSWTCQSSTSVSGCFKAVTNTSSLLCLPSMPAGIYNITLTVYLTCDSCTTYTLHSTSQQLEVKVQSPPILSVGVKCISCQAVGDYRVSKSHHTVLSAFCSETSIEVRYFWNITEDGVRPIDLRPQDTSTGTTASNLVVLRNTILKDGHSYKFTVTAVSTDGSHSESQAYIILLPNMPPSGGSCTAAPRLISVLQETVTVTCSGWKDQDDVESDLLYEIKVMRDAAASASYLLYHGTRSMQAVYVSPWPGTSSSQSWLVVSVLDINGARTEALRELINFRNPGLQAGNLSKELFLAANVTLTMLVQQGDPIPLLQYALALTQMLNLASTRSLPTGDIQLQSLVRTAIIVCVSNHIPVETLQQAQQLAFLLSQLTEFSAEYQTSGCHTLTLQTLQSIAGVLHGSVRPGLDREDFAFESLYSSIYHLLKVVSLELSTTPSSPTSLPLTSAQAPSVSFTDLFPQLLSLSSQLSSTMQGLHLDVADSTWTAEHKMRVVTEAFSLVENVTSAVLKSMVLDEENITFEVGGMKVEGERTRAGSVGPAYYRQEGCRFSVPPLLLSWLNDNEEVLKIMTVFTTNPYTWGYITQEPITTTVPTLSFKYSNGSDLPIANLSSTLEIIMFKSGVDMGNYSLGNNSLLQSPHYDPLAAAKFETWTLPRGHTKKLLVDASDGTTGISALQVQVRIAVLPNSSDLVSGFRPSSSVRAYLGAGFEASETSYTDYKEITSAHMAAGADHHLYTFFVPPSDFKKEMDYTITLVNKDNHHDVNISAFLYLSSCQYYDESAKGWSQSGCSVSDQSIPMATICHCSHLTAFGGSSLVPLSRIRFSDLAELELGVNPVVMVAVAVIIILYVANVIICRYLDCTDLRRISSVPLCGRDGEFKYLITVFTGRHIGAGTSAHVGIKLYGDQNKTEPRHMSKTVAFQRNSCDSFIIATDNELGYLHKVRVWHDNSGPAPSWYLRQIQVQDLQTGQRYVFPANTWLSVEVEDGTLQKEICAAGSEELRSFSHIFSSSFSHNMAERHMWLSIINRPDHSRFTRVQRATCCVTLIFLYMFVNAVWFGLIKDASTKTDPISWNIVGWEEVVIAMVSAVIIFPLALLLICIFKKSRCKGDMFTQAMRPQSAQTLEIEAMCDMSQYGGSLRTVTPIDDWSSLFERESTTESIPPISSQLRRTTAVSRSNKEPPLAVGTFPGSGYKSSVQSIRRTQDLMWNQENIFKSWPEKLPTFDEEEKEKTSNKTNDVRSKPSRPLKGTLEKSTSNALRTLHTAHRGMEILPLPQTVSTSKGITKASSAKVAASTRNDTEHEQFMQRLDEIDRELQKSSFVRTIRAPSTRITTTKTKPTLVKKLSRSSQGGMEDLFESDDDWCNDTQDDVGARKGSHSSVLHSFSNPSNGRRTSQSSLTRLRATAMHVPSSADSTLLRHDSTFMQHDSIFMRRDSTLHSFMMSEKSRTTLSAIIRTRVPVETGRCRLPWYCVYVGYALCMCLSVASILMVLLYGYNFGPAVALEWLLSVLLAFLFSILVLEPLKVLILTLYVAVITKDAEKDMESGSIDLLPSIEANEQLKEVKFRPLGGYALLQAQDEGRKKRRLRTMVRKAIAYLLLTATLIAVANLYYGPAVFRCARHIENNFISMGVNRTTFHKISSKELFWAWARDILTPALYRYQQAIGEEHPVLVGPSRLRQIRSTAVGCLSNMTLETRPCLGQLEFSEDTVAYSPGWLSIPASNTSWQHSAAVQLNTRYKFGHEHLYSGGGYVQDLGTSYNQTRDILTQLQSSQWLDRRSRALFLEWTMYSPAEDLFSAVTLLLEFPMTGGVLSSCEILTEKLFLFDNKIDALYICQALMFISALYLLIQSLLMMTEQKWKFFHRSGNWLQLLVGLLTLASISFYVACVVAATDVAKRFSASSASFTNFDHVVHLHELLRGLHACLLFLLFLKIAGQIRYFRPLSVFIHTLAAALGRLAAATFIFLVLLLTYTQLGYLFYGSVLSGFRSFQSSLLTMFGVMKGRMNFAPALEAQPIFSHFFFYTFYAFVYGLFVALVIAILQDAYKVTRSHMYFKSSLEPQDYEMIEFMLKRFKLWAGIIKPKPAFRRVKFEGLSSLPSRGSSSATSSRPCSQNSRDRNTPTPDLIASMNTGTNALDRLLPAWEKLLSLLGTMEKLEKEEQKLMGSVHSSFKLWSSEQDKKVQSAGGKKGRTTADRPPLDPKRKLSKFRSNFQNSSIENQPRAGQSNLHMVVLSSGRMNRSPTAEKKLMMRALSDQGVSDNTAADRAALVGPGSDSLTDRQYVNDGLSSYSGIADTFPGSASQRVRPKADAVRTQASLETGTLLKDPKRHKLISASSLSTAGLNKVRPDPEHQPGKAITVKNLAADTKKQAWES